LIYMILGCLAFVFLVIFDLNKIILFNKIFNLFFPIGIVVLGISTVAILFGDFESFYVSIYLRWFFGLMSLISLLLMLYCLFLALPFAKTYQELEKENTVIDTGVYALCRHPGVIWVFLFYVFLGLASAKVMMLGAALVWNAMNVLYVFVQDRFIFPQMLTGYQSYQERVPFIIPNADSIRNYLSLRKH